MTLGKKWVPWSDAEDSDLRARCKDGVKPGAWGEIAAYLPGRSKVACRQRWLNLRRKDRGETGPMRPPKPRRTNGRVYHDAREAMQAPPDPSALPRHASLTALICGDPLPGRSALDQGRDR